jgi:hypothetical protein
VGEFDDPYLPGVTAPKPPSIPRFHVTPVKLEFASAQAGRPIFEDREFVDIITPGSRNQIAHEPVGEEHKRLWPKEYEAFRAGREAPLQGTPLADWPGMNRARVEELAYFNVRTVEELAGVNDIQLQNLGMGVRSERDKARLFLEAARTGSAPLERMLARNEELTRENERLAQQLASLAQEAARLREEAAVLRGVQHATSPAA